MAGGLFLALLCEVCIELWLPPGMGHPKPGPEMIAQWKACENYDPWEPDVSRDLQGKLCIPGSPETGLELAASHRFVDSLGLGHKRLWHIHDYSRGMRDATGALRPRLCQLAVHRAGPLSPFVLDLVCVVLGAARGAAMGHGPSQKTFRAVAETTVAAAVEEDSERSE